MAHQADAVCTVLIWQSDEVGGKNPHVHKDLHVEGEMTLEEVNGNNN